MSELTVESISAANARHDREHGHPLEYDRSRIRSSWNEQKLARRGKLTDRQLAKYEKAGYYAADFRAARREVWQQRAARRQGNFEAREDGRLIYKI